MGLHRFFRGDRTQCARLYPFALRKLNEMRAFMRRAGIGSFVRKFDNTMGDVRVSKHGSEEFVEIRVEGSHVFYVVRVEGSADIDEDNYREVFSSRTARDAFRPRGEAVVPSLGEKAHQIMYFAGPDGLGEAVVFLEHYDENEAPRLSCLRTRDFVTYRVVYDFGNMFSDSGGFAIPSVAHADGAMEKSLMVVDPTFERADTGDTGPMVLYSVDGGHSWRLTSFLVDMENVGYVAPGTIRFGPRFVWILFTAFDERREVDGHRNYSFVVYTTDNGDTWQQGDGGELISDIGTHVDNGHYLVAVTRGMGAVRLDDGSYLVATRAAVYGDGHEVRVYKSTPTSSFTLVDTFRLDDEFIDPINDYTVYNGDMFMVQGVPVYTAINGNNRRVAMFVAESNGTTWEERPLPGDVYNRPHPIDRDTIVVESYTGTDYVLYESTDLGETWEHRAVLIEDAPDPTGGPNLLTWVWGVGTPADPGPTFPGQPWIGDARIIPPWEQES